MNKYHNIACWDTVLNIDAIMDEYELDKISILDLLENEPHELVRKMWKENTLCIDNTCQFKMGQNPYSDFACVNCVNMKHIIDLNENTIGEPFNVLTGAMVGNDLLLTETKVPYTYLTLNHYKMKGDTFTVKILLLWVIERLFSKLPNAIQLKTAFICNHTGYTLYKAPTIDGELCDFDCLIEKDPAFSAYGILSQLIVIFNELKNIQFVLGHASIYAFLFDKKPCSFLYQKIAIKNKYTLCLADVAQSSAVIHKVCLSSENNVDELYTSHSKCVVTQKDQFKIKCVSDLYLNQIKQKYPLDFYLVLMSLLRNNVFFETLNKEEEALNLVKQLWDYDEIVKRVDENDDDDFTLLQDVWLYTDPTTLALSMM